MSWPASAERARSFSRPRSHVKNVSSWRISIGPRSASAAARDATASMLSIRALISMLRAVAPMAGVYAEQPSPHPCPPPRGGRVLGFDEAAERGAVGSTAAHGVVLIVQDEQVLVGAGVREGIEAGQTELGAGFPPAVAAADDVAEDRIG